LIIGKFGQAVKSVTDKVIQEKFLDLIQAKMVMSIENLVLLKRRYIVTWID
jgi:hypothetical protein